MAKSKKSKKVKAEVEMGNVVPCISMMDSYNPPGIGQYRASDADILNATGRDLAMYRNHYGYDGQFPTIDLLNSVVDWATVSDGTLIEGCSHGMPTVSAEVIFALGSMFHPSMKLGEPTMTTVVSKLHGQTFITICPNEDVDAVINYTLGGLQANKLNSFIRLRARSDYKFRYYLLAKVYEQVLKDRGNYAIIGMSNKDTVVECEIIDGSGKLIDLDIPHYVDRVLYKVVLNTLLGKTDDIIIVGRPTENHIPKLTNGNYNV